MKILHNISLIKTSSAEPLASKSGVIYSSGSSVYLTDKSGAVFDLAANKGSMVITEYITPGTHTWNKNPSINFNIKYLQVVCVGAGGGGGGGRSGATNTVRGGGGGGAGGAISVAWFESSSLTTSSYTIQVGAGGAGGAGGVGGSNGAAGSPGGQSLFRSGSTNLVQAGGGQGGVSGQNAVPNPRTNGNTTQVIPSGQLLNFAGMSGGEGGYGSGAPNASPNQTPQLVTLGGSPAIIASYCKPSFNGFFGCGGGGGGGGISSTNTAQNGGTGSAVFKNGQLVFTGSAGTAGGGGSRTGTNGVNNFINGLVLAGFSSSLYSSSFGVGTPGHGGAASSDIVVNGGNGGSGSIGCGGGGGGAGTSGGSATGGTGGKGGNGYVLLIAYY